MESEHQAGSDRDQHWTQLTTQQLTDKWQRNGRGCGFVARDMTAQGMQRSKRRKEGDDLREVIDVALPIVVNTAHA